MHKILKRFEIGEATRADLDLLLEVANNIEGNTICALGDAAAWPVQSMIKRFPEEFERRVKPGAAPGPPGGGALGATGGGRTAHSALASFPA
jgi:NADH-quinone oxidoreductase subunit F